MSTLIVTILAVVLFALLALAGVFFGGGAWLHSPHEATAAQVINTSSQISAGIDLYRTDHNGAVPAEMSDLVDGGYLRSLPDASDWQFGDDVIERSGLAQQDCESVNKKISGDPTVPNCADTGPGFIGCCSKTSG